MCHNLPIETLRYSKIKVKRDERLCKICPLDEIGDEEHYLHRCNNEEMVEIKKMFIGDARNSIMDFKHFNEKCIIDYCTIMHDERIQVIFSTFVKQILNKYREVIENTEQIPPKITQTRCGRVSKRPDKLNL